jgi:hypothetical protein
MASGLPHAEEGVVKIGIVNHLGAKLVPYVTKYLQSFDVVMADGYTLRPVLDVLKATLECSSKEGSNKDASRVVRELTSRWRTQASEAEAIRLSTREAPQPAAPPPPQIALTGTLPIPSAAEQAAASHHQ